MTTACRLNIMNYYHKCVLFLNSEQLPVKIVLLTVLCASCSYFVTSDFLKLRATVLHTLRGHIDIEYWKQIRSFRRYFVLLVKI